MRDDYDYGGTEPGYGAPFPGSILGAGIIWIIFGCLILLGAGINFLMIVGQPRAGGPEAVGGSCGLAIQALFGAVFLLVGIQSVQGTAKDTLGNGIGSIVFAALQFGGAALILFGTAALGGVPCRSASSWRECKSSLVSPSCWPESWRW
jgi:hypothetical protein